jgi:phosphomevalonate kinase
MGIRRRYLLIALITACGGDEPYRPGECLHLPRPPSRDVVGFERVFSGVTIPEGVDLVQSPAGDRWYVVTQPGRIYTFPNVAEPPAPTLFADLSAQVVVGGEAGLLGMAFHPGFADNGEVFLSYTGPGGDVFTSRVSRFLSADGGLTLDLASEQEILAVEQPYSNHNGGDIGFGRDGYLYFGLGDGGSSGDPLGSGQDVDSLLGKILRVDVDGGDPYAIPAGNPFAGGGGRPEIFAWGLRNPWRFSFDRETGALWAGDVGQNVWEEVDRIELGKNYGWNVKEGPDCFGQDVCDEAGLVDPVAQYRNTGGASVIAGFVYRGADIPAIVGTFVYADFYAPRLFGVKEGEAPVVLGDNGVRQISSFAEDGDGELYALNYEGGIYKLRAAAPADGPGLPGMLSETGCLEMGEPGRAPGRALAYELNVPFWSDGADKRRWMFLPEDSKISVGADGDWDLPAGSVIVKSFYRDDVPIETRLFVRHDDGGWAGYSYAWEGGDARLLDGGETREVGGGPWIFPGRDECMYCHSAEAGRTLGLETSQLARMIVDEDGAMVQPARSAGRARGAGAAAGGDAAAGDRRRRAGGRAGAGVPARQLFAVSPAGRAERAGPDRPADRDGGRGDGDVRGRSALGRPRAGGRGAGDSRRSGALDPVGAHALAREHAHACRRFGGGRRGGGRADRRMDRGGRGVPAVTRVLALSGKRFAGKDTVAAMLVELARERGVAVSTYAFAGESKRLFVQQQRASGVEVELAALLADRSYKEAWRPKLTEFTVESLRADPLIFCRAVADRIETSEGRAVVTDLRLRLEIEHLRARFELYVVRITRPDSLRASSGWQYSPEADGHPTETELDDPGLWDEELINDGTMAQLRERVASRFSRWLA